MKLRQNILAGQCHIERINNFHISIHAVNIRFFALRVYEPCQTATILNPFLHLILK